MQFTNNLIAAVVCIGALPFSMQRPVTTPTVDGDLLDQSLLVKRGKGLSVAGGVVRKGYIKNRWQGSHPPKDADWFRRVQAIESHASKKAWEEVSLYEAKHKPDTVDRSNHIAAWTRLAEEKQAKEYKPSKTFEEATGGADDSD